MIFAYPTCATCQFKTQLEGSRFLLCTLPPECAPPRHDDQDDQDDDWRRDYEERMAVYVGTNCDVMRRMGAMCGPRGDMWADRQGSE